MLLGSSATKIARYAVLALGLLAVPVSAFAQDDPNAAPPISNSASADAGIKMPTHHHEAWMHDLDLTPAQKAQMKAIHEKFKNEHPDKMASESDRKAMMEQIMSVLTPAQREKAHEEHAKMMKHHHKHMGAHPDQMPTVAP
jgi:Spy/CpxP family protein refolding chaperone